MSARHTSGPWKARFEKVRYVIFVDGEIGEKALATTGGAYPDSQANARLIASAPDMLETLQQLEYWFNTDAEILDAMTEAERADHIRQHEKIRKAIAKALGEQA